MTQIDVDEMRVAIDSAKREWCGCEWKTEFGPRKLNLCGLKSRQALVAAKATRGEESKCWAEAGVWLASVERDAGNAAELADQALAALRLAQTQVAQKLLGDAVDLESVYRDPVAYRPLQRLVNAAFPSEPLLL